MKYFGFIAFFLIGMGLSAQTSDVLLNPDYHHQVDRLDIKEPFGFTGVKPYNREDITARLDSENDTLLHSSYTTQYLKTDNYLFDDSNDTLAYRKPVFRHFYKAKPSLYSHTSENFRLSVNPMLYFQTGFDNNANNSRLFLNTRGAEVYGSIDNKIGFYAMVTDNQMRVPDYVSNQIYAFGATPGENLWKIFGETGFDFFTAKGYLTFRPTKSVRMKFGYDKNFIGNGYRSMILSDYAGNYTHLRIDTKVWKLHYTNIFADLNADLTTNTLNVPVDSQDPLPKKFLALHRLDWKIRDNLSLGLFESIIYGGDSLGQNTFNVNYLNPIVFYRSIEGNVGSGQGNAMVGLDLKWNFLNHFSLYGQFVLDEFKLDQIKARTGWWANKYAGQVGLKYIDVANIRNLDLQLEYNSARPFIYSHTTKRTSYSHYNQPLANPLGANFNEFIAIFRYQPFYKLSLTAKVFMIEQGNDLNGDNYGSNVLLANPTRIRHNTEDTGHKQLQGSLTRTRYVDLGVSYMLMHNLYLDGNVTLRRSLNNINGTNNLTYIQTGLRLNLARRVHEF